MEVQGRYGIAHGHAIAKLWPYMACGNGPYTVPNGREQLEAAFQKIAWAMEYETVLDAIRTFDKLLEHLDLSVPLPSI